MLLGALIIVGGLFSGDSRLGSVFPLILIVNHTLLLTLTLVAARANGLGLRELGWGLGSSRPPRSRLFIPVELAIGLVAGLALAAISRFFTGPLVVAAARTFGDIGGLPLEFKASFDWLVAVTLFAGVAHETLYRGYALRVLGERQGIVRAVLVSSVFFAVFHWPQGLLTVVSIIPDGVAFCLLVLWRKNLWVPFAAHVVFNLSTLLIFS